jgi:nitroreductase
MILLRVAVRLHNFAIHLGRQRRSIPCGGRGTSIFLRPTGAIATALVNAAWSRGLGTVINSQGIMQSPVVREHARIPDDQVIMKSIALGWPDEEFPPMPLFRSAKALQETAFFVGFE